MTILETLATTLPVLFLVALGLLLRRIRLISAAAVAELKTLIVSLTLPLVLFKAFATMQFEIHYLWIILAVFLACTLVMLLAARLSFVPGLTSPYASYLMAGFEAGMLGYAVFGAIYGQNNISRFAVIDLGQVLFVFFVLVTRLEHHQGRRLNMGATLLNIIKTPVIVAILLGVTANLSGFYRLLEAQVLTASLLHTAELLAAMTMPLVGLVIGYELHFNRRSLGQSFLTVLLRLLVWVGLALALIHLLLRPLLGIDPLFEAAALVMAVLPAPFVIPLYLQKGAEKERDYILNTLSLGTLAALLGTVIIKLL